jgi:hypothetical protein
VNRLRAAAAALVLASLAWVGIGDILPNWTHIFWEGGDFLCRGNDCWEIIDGKIVPE